MTERWRKRLHDLDGVAPDDEVFRRAEEGPYLPDAPIPRPSTSTRVVTAVAAFGVFALAIAVFAIPALRLNGDVPGGAGSSPPLPLWPARTLEEVEAIQADADAGVPTERGPTATQWLDPETVATSFGRDVMGWSDASAIEYGGSSATDCQTYAYANPGPSSSSTGYLGSDDPVHQYLCVPDGTYANSVPPSGWYGYPSSGTLSPFRTFAVYPCDPNGTCDGQPGFLDPARWKIGMPPAVNVTLYQPLGFDKGNVWMVLSAESSFGELPVKAGAAVANDTSLRIQAIGWDDLSLDAGFVATGTEGCRAGGSTVAGGDQAKLVVDISIDPEACPEQVPGFLFLAVRERDGSTGTVVDPLDPGSDKPLLSLVAAPVTFLVPDAPVPTQETSEPSVGSTPTAPTSPTPEAPLNWTTYTDQLGWTIDVPDSWVTEPFVDDSSIRVTESGTWFSSGAPPSAAASAGPAVAAANGVSVSIWSTEGGPVSLSGNDSAFPLSFEDLHAATGGPEGLAGSFRGDGLSFSIYVTFDSLATTEQEIPTVRQMIESITFQPWQTGETRNGWTALAPPESDVDWQELGNDQKTAATVVVLRTANGFEMFGPMPSCGAGENKTSVDGEPVLECPDGTIARWTVDGEPYPDNPPSCSAVPVGGLGPHAVITAWDGTLLSRLDERV